MNVKKVIKGIISYILALILAVIFALYLNANVGWYMLIALTLAPVMSVFFAWLTSKFVVVDVGMDDCVLSKGDHCSLVVNLTNKSIFPTTPMELIVLNGDGVRCTEKQILCSVMPFSESTVKIDFEARICGPSKIGIKEIRVTDYLGLISFKAKKIDYRKTQGNISVIPDIADISIKDDRILKVMQASISADDSEDTVESSVSTFGGFPGYDHRDYVPGDPLKRINWKQSAKRDKLLVRLDDEMASKSVVVILDSTFVRYGINIKEECFDDIRYNYSEEEILPKIAEDAIENALGIVRSLILSGYNVNFYVRGENRYENYQIEDDKDLENIRISMASYSFLKDKPVNRFPVEALSGNMTGAIISTPCSYSDVYTSLEAVMDVSKASVFSSLEDIRSNVIEDSGISRIRYGTNKKQKRTEKDSLKDRLIRGAKPYVIPYLLSLVLSITVFSVFDVSLVSFWTILQIIVCGLIVYLCDYAKKNKVVGGLSITILVILLLSLFIGIVIKSGEYSQWFMSGGDLVENTPFTLMSLIFVFTVFFTMVIFYYTCVYYRTSALLLVAMIPFVIYVKVIKEVDIIYVMLVVALNVLAFLLNTRKQRDKGKRIVGNIAGIISLVFYGVIFVLTALAIPKNQETKYYYIFEEYFLGGNTTVDLPDAYKQSNEYSGNADNFNQLTNRKLYTITGVYTDNMIYLRRQIFDYYDFENDRWYKNKEYSEKSISLESYDGYVNYLDNQMLADAFLRAEELSPGFLEKYGLQEFNEHDIVFGKKRMTIEAHNYESDTYITPQGTIRVITGYLNPIYVTPHGIFGSDTALIDEDVQYEVDYYDRDRIKNKWIMLGGSNISENEAKNMREELLRILTEYEELTYIKCVKAFDRLANEAYSYKETYGDNAKMISSKVKELAQEITEDCQEDWQKAKAIEKYFHENDFVYDIDYNASDDSVEYFLFNSKRGTCSDFATAYVLLARSIGLNVRYVEGFVPEEEIGLSYEKEYVVRTNCSHAYPEVYIENLGYLVFEPTVSVGDDDAKIDGDLVDYILIFGFRILLVFIGVSLICSICIFTVKIVIPVIQENRYKSKILKLEYNEAIITLYQRIVGKYAKALIGDGEFYTPYEYAVRFNEIVEYDIWPLVDMVEKTAYRGKEIYYDDVHKAFDMYLEIKKAIKEQKKKLKKQRRNYGR